MRLFSDPAEWRRMAAGARRMCLEEMNLERNAGQLQQLLCRTAWSDAAEDRT